MDTTYAKIDEQAAELTNEAERIHDEIRTTKTALLKTLDEYNAWSAAIAKAETERRAALPAWRRRWDDAPVWLKLTTLYAVFSLALAALLSVI